jgi:DUF1365 family protein
VTGSSRATRPVDRAISLADLPPLPALVVGTVHHARHTPIRTTFTHRHYQWLVDLDDPPRLPWPLRPFATLRGEDHLDGRPGLGALRADVLSRVAAADIPTADITRVVMLAHARVLGHVFDPMSAFWCFAADGGLRAVLVEVHNTYGGRHAYAVQPDERGLATVDKALYVSPFNDVSGTYRLGFALSPQQALVTVRLDRDGAPVISTSVRGRCVPATPGRVAATLLRHPFMPQRVTLLIRRHGIALWLRRLAVQPRPTEETTP